MARRSGRGPLAMSATGIPRHAPALSMAALVGLAALLTAAQLSLSAGIPRLVLTLLMWAVYVGGACAVGLLPSRQALWLAVGGGAALQALAIRVRPWTTDDFRRYAWDGRVQAAGIDPYRYAPQDPQLAFLRDPWLFPDGVHTALNHPLAHTIYPPFAQGYFWLVEVLPGGPGRGFALQLSFALVAVATSVAIVAALRGAGADVRRVVWWSWCPTVVMEAGGNAHIDVLAALLAVGFVVALTRERWSRAGVFLGLAVATKFLPLLLAVAILHAAPPESWRLPEGWSPCSISLTSSCCGGRASRAISAAMWRRNPGIGGTSCGPSSPMRLCRSWGWRCSREPQRGCGGADPLLIAPWPGPRHVRLPSRGRCSCSSPCPTRGISRRSSASWRWALPGCGCSSLSRPTRCMPQPTSDTPTSARGSSATAWPR